MKTITKKCKQCLNNFECNLKEHTRGNGLFCSLSCVSTFGNTQKEKHELSCKHCGSKFLTVSRATAKYCSLSCKQKNYRLRANNNTINQKALLDKIRSTPCSICGWEESVRDAHHIVPVSQGGQNDELNLISLCPNHHRMVHKSLISQDSLFKAIKTRTISSS